MKALPLARLINFSDLFIINSSIAFVAPGQDLKP
jgi:hypothetical protein